MNILIVGDSFSPDARTGAARLESHSRRWAEAGEDVTILVGQLTRGPAPVARTGAAEQFKRARARGSDGLERGGTDALRGVRARRVLLRRAIPRLFLAALGVKWFEVVVCSSSKQQLRLAALLISRIRRRPFALEVLEQPRRSPWRRIVARRLGADPPLTLWFCKAADVVLTTTGSRRDGLVRQGVDPTKVVVVSDGLDWDRYRSVSRRSSRNAEADSATPLVVGWVDVSGRGAPAPQAAGVAERLQASGLQHRFHMLDLSTQVNVECSGDEKAGEHSDARKPSRTDDHDRRGGRTECPVPSLARLDLCVIVQGEGAGEPMQHIPQLVYDCIGSGIPMIVGVAGEAADLVLREEVGLVSHGQDLDELTALLRRLAEDAMLRARMVAACREVAPRLDRASRAMLMLEALRGASARHKMHRKWYLNRHLSGYER